MGRISAFGLLEMSRQRLRPSLVEASTQPCPHCGGTGFIRSTESTALYVLRSIEEEGMRRRSAEVCVHVPTTVALYILNHKRDSLAQLETRYGVHVLVARDDALIPPAFRLERLRAYEPGEAAPAVPLPLTQAPEIDEEEPEEEDAGETEAAEAEPQGRDDDEERGRSRRRRRRRRRHEDERGAPASAHAAEDDAEPKGEPVAAGGRAAGASHGEETPEAGRDEAVPHEAGADGAGAHGTVAHQAEVRGGEAQDGEVAGEDDKLRRRRGRRGGRRRGRREEGSGPSFEDPRPASQTIEVADVSGGGEDEPVGEADFLGEGYPSDSDFGADLTGEASSETTAAWPADAPATDEIETASLPALAGEVSPSRSSPSAAEWVEPSRTILAVDEVGSGPVWTPTVGNAESAAGSGADSGSARHPAGEAAPPAVYRETSEQREDSDASLATPPATLQPQAVPRSEVVAELQPEPAPAVQTVTEKPPSPRKGWWQRLMQS